jgi:hypothetical protein
VLSCIPLAWHWSKACGTESAATLSGPELSSLTATIVADRAQMPPERRTPRLLRSGPMTQQPAVKPSPAVPGQVDRHPVGCDAGRTGLGCCRLGCQMRSHGTRFECLPMQAARRSTTFGDGTRRTGAGIRGTARGTSTSRIPVLCVRSGQIPETLVQVERAVPPSSPLLIRGFGVRVPGGAPVYLLKRRSVTLLSVGRVAPRTSLRMRLWRCVSLGNSDAERLRIRRWPGVA